MKKTILERYEVTENKEIIIDVSVQSVERLYDDFDKTAPYHRKELDEQFVDYLTRCVDEIGSNPFIVRLSLENMPDESLMDRINKSVNSYYYYLKEIEVRGIRRMLRRFAILFIAGLVLLVLAILATRRASIHHGVVAEVFAQGLTIAAWISLWEALANIFLELRPRTEAIKLYNRIIESKIIFRKV